MLCPMWTLLRQTLGSSHQRAAEKSGLERIEETDAVGYKEYREGLDLEVSHRGSVRVRRKD